MRMHSLENQLYSFLLPLLQCMKSIFNSSKKQYRYELISPEKLIPKIFICLQLKHKQTSRKIMIRGLEICRASDD